MGPGDAQSLPQLRQDLRLHKGATTLNGQQSWLIYDPVRHRYFEISERIFRILSLWNSSEPGTLGGTVKTVFDLDVNDEEIDDLKFFLYSNSLTELPAGDDSRAFVEQLNKSRRGLLSTAVHSYLFYKIPLVQPERFLRATYPWISFLYSRVVFGALVSLGIIGLYLVSRQWESFAGSFLYFFSLEGAGIYALSLVFVKLLHELGHAYTAVRYGVRVPSIGVAFMLMFPVLYTDVTDAWRLKDKKERLGIAGAGIIVELAVAAIATLLWSILPDGPARSVMFVLATSSWLLSIGVNLNPFMRFDGYYLFADWWGISNLQPRAFAIGRWWIRELLFDLKTPPPDNFRPATRRKLVIYALCVWIYRLVLFIGIALLVYHMFFKALGVLLFVTEIVWFVLLPIYRELEMWWLSRETIMSKKRIRISAGFAAIALFLFVFPWSGTISVPSFLVSIDESPIFAPVPARVDELLAKDGEHVEKGQILARLSAPHIDHQIDQAMHKAKLLEARLARIAGSGRERLQLRVTQEQLKSAVEEFNGLNREKERLTIRAPISGTLRDLNDNIHIGRWVSIKERLALIVNTDKMRFKGVVMEDTLSRVSQGAEGRFVPEDPSLASISVRLDEISPVGEDKLESNYLASKYGGALAVEEDKQGDLKPLSGVHTVLFSGESNINDRVIRGVVLVEAKPESLARASIRQLLRVIIRESGV